MPRSTRSIPRLLRTVRHLSSRQIIGQLRLRLRSLGGDRLAKWADKQTPEQMEPAWSPVTDFLPPPQASMDADAIRRGELTFLNQTYAIGSPLDWGTTQPPKLWQYNLHYMDYLWALPADGVRALVLDYIERHPPKQGNCGWEPYPLSLRLMNWCALLYGRDREQTLADHAEHAKISGCIRLMAAWLSQNLETHICANHLLENYLALAMTGNCFVSEAELPEGKTTYENELPVAWWLIGVEGLQNELGEQTLADGGHYERSPMYQSRLLCALLWVLNSARPKYREMLTPYAQRMANHLAAMTHPDGQIALFNDAAFGIYNTPGELFDFAERLGIEVDRKAVSRSAWLAESGYAVGGSDNAADHRFIMDAGELGPSYQPGHAHSDLLSFELSLFGKRLVVDAGNYDYVASDMRAYCRGVEGHNTIEINGQDQCELWSAFRVGRRAYPRKVAVDCDPSTGELSVSASHNGYDHLPGRPRHTRRATWHPEGVLLVEDRVDSAEEVDVVSRLRLGEGWTLRPVNVDHYELAQGGDVATIRLFGEAGWEVEDGWTCPHFYDKRPCRVLTLRARGSAVRCGFIIAAGTIDGAVPFESVELGGKTYAF